MDLEGEGGKRSLEICSRSSSGGKSSRWASRSHRLSCDTQLGVHVGDHLPLLDQGDGVGCFRHIKEAFEVLGDT